MPPRRFRLVAYENYRPRDNLDVPTITQLLKQLKSGYKNVRSSQKQLFAEMHILERVYYKGKNQHGLSLFWRSVVSVRRMSGRIYETNVPRLLEILGGMFHEEPFEGQKAFSGAWTRLPPPENIAQILGRLLDIGALLKAVIASFRKAYRAFCLAMPNTAFLQLTVVLVSIVSRTSALASTLLDNLLLIIPRVYAVFEVLEPPAPLLRKLSKLLKKFSLDSSHPDTQVHAPPHAPTPRTSNPPASTAMFLDDQDEDLGSTVARTTLPTEPPTSIVPPPSPPRIIVPDSPIGPESEQDAEVETTTPLSPPPNSSQQPRPVQIFPVELEAPAVATVPAAVTGIVPRDRDARMAVVKPKKKRKKARDEIDDIFG